MSEPTLDRAAFRAWLVRQEWAGVRSSCGHCPLALYLRFVGAPDPYVDQAHYWLDFDADSFRLINERKFLLPAWAQEFVHRVDRSGRSGSRAKRRTALAILDAIPETADA